MFPLPYLAKTLLRLVQNDFQAEFLLANSTAPGQELVGYQFASPWPRWWIRTDGGVPFSVRTLYTPDSHEKLTVERAPICSI